MISVHFPSEKVESHDYSRTNENPLKPLVLAKATETKSTEINSATETENHCLVAGQERFRNSGSENSWFKDRPLSIFRTVHF